jgi:hypothetical protein
MGTFWFMVHDFISAKQGGLIMNLEYFLKILEPRPPLWATVWAFFLLLINPKLRKQVDEHIKEKNEIIRKLELQTKEADERYEAMIKKLKKL